MLRNIPEAHERTFAVTLAAHLIGYTDDDAMRHEIYSHANWRFEEAAPCDNTFTSHPEESEYNNLYTDKQVTDSLEQAWFLTFGLDCAFEHNPGTPEYRMEASNWLAYAAIAE